MSGRRLFLCCAVVFSFAASAAAQRTPGPSPGRSTPSEDVEQVTTEARQTPEAPASTADRPIYQAIQQAKKELYEKYGITFALEDTLIYQHTSGGVDPNDAMVNTLGLFATWKIFRSDNGKDFAGLGFQGETRGDLLDSHFTELRDSLGTLW